MLCLANLIYYLFIGKIFVYKHKSQRRWEKCNQSGINKNAKKTVNSISLTSRIQRAIISTILSYLFVPNFVGILILHRKLSLSSISIKNIILRLLCQVPIKNLSRPTFISNLCISIVKSDKPNKKTIKLYAISHYVVFSQAQLEKFILFCLQNPLLKLL